MRFWTLALVLATLIAGASGSAPGQSRKPKLAPGIDPGGIAIAIISTGIDYTRPDVARLLARDGEGELIGWDFVDGDNRPYMPAEVYHSDLAVRLGSALQARAIALRIDPSRPQMVAQAIDFAARTPARLVLFWVSDDKPHVMSRAGNLHSYRAIESRRR